MRCKRVHMPRGYSQLHIDLPGCVVNVTVGLRDLDGREVTRVDVDADGDRFAGDPPWWAAWGDCDRKGGCVRVIQGEPSRAVRQ